MQFRKNIKSLISVYSLIFALSAGCGGSSGDFLPAPELISVEAGNKSLTVTWNTVPGAETYNIYLAASSGVNKVNYNSLNSGIRLEWNVSPRIIRDLQNDTTYYIVVTARKGNIESKISNEIGATPLAIPLAPLTINAVAGDSETTLFWSTAAGESYNLFWSLSPGILSTNYDGVFANVTSPFVHSGLVNGQSYYYTVSASNQFGESPHSNEISVTPSALAGTTVTLSGTLNYEDKVYGRGGFNGDIDQKAIRYASVEVVDSSTAVVLANGSSDKNGDYNIAFNLMSSSTLYLRVLSETSSPDSQALQVRTLTNNIYAIGGVDMNVNPGEDVYSNMTIPVSKNAGAFNILDAFVSGGEFINALSLSFPPLLKAYWLSGNDYYGTYFCRASDKIPGCINGEGIYLVGGKGSGLGDHDEYDDDVIWHEYGHFVADKYSRDDSPGGVHFLSNNDLDLRLAWSEGWGDFFPSALKEWLLASDASLLSIAPDTPSTIYLDVRDSWLFIFDIDKPSSQMVYSSNEVAVANILWNVMQGTPGGLNGLWATFSDYISNTHDAAFPVNLEAFWDGWLYKQVPTSLELSELETLYGQRKISYAPDPFESDDTIASAGKIPVGNSELHTLYAGNDPTVSDSDKIAFDATQGLTYLIQTSSLVNGADTYLRLIDRDGTTLLEENDNGDPDTTYTAPYNLNLLDGVYHENNGTTLASEITFVAYSTGTYYIEVSKSSNSPLSAGRYGGYSLDLSVQ